MATCTYCHSTDTKVSLSSPSVWFCRNCRAYFYSKPPETIMSTPVNATHVLFGDVDAGTELKVTPLPDGGLEVTLNGLATCLTPGQAKTLTKCLAKWIGGDV